MPKLWMDPWNHMPYRDYRLTINGGDANPDYGKWYTDDSTSNCFSCRCCGDAPNCEDTEFGSGFPAIVRIVWELGFCSCVRNNLNDPGSWLFLNSPATIDGAAMYCCLDAVPDGSGSGSGGSAFYRWQCRADLDCYTDYRWFSDYPCNDDPDTGNETTGRRDLQLVCTVLATGAGAGWTIRITLTIETPDGLGSVLVVDMGAPGSNIGEEFGCVQESGPPIEGIHCSDSNAAPPAPPEWAGQTIRDLYCVGCECEPGFFIVGPNRLGSGGTASYCACNNF